MLFLPSDLDGSTTDEMLNRKCLRLMFEGNATPDQAQTARAYILNATQFYEPASATDTGIIANRREGMRSLMVGLLNLTRFSVSELESTNSQGNGPDLS